MSQIKESAHMYIFVLFCGTEKEWETIQNKVRISHVMGSLPLNRGLKKIAFLAETLLEIR